METYLADLTLYVTGASAATIDLHGQTVAQVATKMLTGITATMTKDGPAELLLWPLGYSTPQSDALPAALTIATNPLWQVLAAISREKTTERRNVRQTMGYINLRAAVGMWLDWWAASLGISRYPSEPGSLFILRLIGITLQSNVNNAAMEQLAATLGYQGTISDYSRGEISVTYSPLPSWPPGFVYSTSQIFGILSQMKAAGIKIVNQSVYGEAIYGVSDYA